ncbi:OLC1v1019323C1 [Oldenlandia corymbosa var. corymbosa]|uniref:OLC1v1019323C1 n=1 Tax=Oldenlandia corymbosa var. corymbosa TaxID=529605 RepID=A0AAV1EDR7_OLDCO|nr:OLC1v1019323C1 [Oldenlandia corymbosa var. corymbosa]
MENNNNNNGGILSEFDLSFLPMDYVADIIALASPRDACSASMVSRVFKSSSDSDTVWEKFLLSDYQQILSKSVDTPPWNYASPIKSCSSTFPLPSSLKWLSWKVFGGSTFKAGRRLHMLSLKTTYAAYLVFGITKDSIGLGQVAEASVRFADMFTVSEPGMNSMQPAHPIEDRMDGQIAYEGRVAQARKDGCREILLGEFFNNNGGDETVLRLSQTTTLNTKRGLILEGIELPPREA